jgi:hypothetical protein
VAARPLAPLPVAVVATAHAQAGLVAAWQLAAGGVAKSRVHRLVDAGVLVRVARGVYDLTTVPAPAGRTARLDRQRERTARLGVLLHGPAAIATGLSALVLHGVRGVPPSFTPEVALRGGGAVARADGARVRREPVPRLVHRGGVPCVPPEVALAQAVGDVDRWTAVALMDSARQRRVLTERTFAVARELARGRRGAARSRRWWDLSDPRAESPAETWARIRLADDGMPPDVLQLPVRGAGGRLLARVDLAWSLGDGRWLLGEVDGIDVHGTPEAVVADLHRQNAIVTGTTILRRWTGRQARSGAFVDDVRRVLDDAGRVRASWCCPRRRRRRRRAERRGRFRDLATPGTDPDGTRVGRVSRAP